MAIDLRDGKWNVTIISVKENRKNSKRVKK